jgi:hypothetical protein
LLEQTPQATARLMNLLRIILIAVATVISITARADFYANQMISSLGNFQVDASGSHVEISKTNDQAVFEVIWRGGDGVKTIDGSVTKEESLTSDWFVFPESASRIWLFDGKDLFVVVKTEKSSGVFSGQEHFENCPKQVEDALPQKVQKRYFN